MGRMSDYAMECDYYGTIEVEDDFDWGYEEDLEPEMEEPEVEAIIQERT